MNEQIPVLELAGTPRQMGEKHGEFMKDQINALANERLEIILSRVRGADLQLIEDTARGVLQETERVAADSFAESEATARAAGLSHWKLLVAGGFSDILDVVARRMNVKAATSECSIWQTRSSDGTPRIVGTWDSHASARRSLIIVRRRPARAVETIALSTAGWMMQQGVTSAGLAFAIANMVARTEFLGTSYICALPEIVKAANAPQAAEVARRIPLCSARYFALADAGGNFRGVETDGRDSWCTNEFLSHTNHFILNGTASVEARTEYALASEQRRLSAQRFSKIATPSIEDLFGAISYNDGTDRSILQSGMGREDRTCAAFVLNPLERALTFWTGAPLSSCSRTVILK
jgi:hypothetical protein